MCLHLIGYNGCEECAPLPARKVTQLVWTHKLIRQHLAASSIRTILVYLLLLALIPVVLVQIVVYASLYNTRIRTESLSNLEVARALSLSFDDYRRDVLREEQAIGLTITSLLKTRPHDVEQYLIANAAEYPAIDSFFWLNSQGQALATGDRSVLRQALADHAIFQQISAGRPWAVSDLILPSGSGKPIFLIARGFRRADGTLQGIMVAVADPNRLGEELAFARVREGAIAIIDHHGVVVFRYPVTPEFHTGHQLPESQPLIRQALMGQEATGTFVSPADNAQHIAGVVPIVDAGWLAIASRPVSVVVTPILHSFAEELLALIIIAGVTFLAAVLMGQLFIRPLAQLQAQAAVIAQGHYEERVPSQGPREIHALALAFNRMAESLHQREQERAIFLHTLSHDLRAPLTAMRGYAQLIQEDIGIPAQVDFLRESVVAVIRNADQMNSMIQDLVDAARLDSGQLHLARHPLAPRLFVEELLQRYRTIWPMPRIHNDIPADVPEIWVDPARFERILVNLISNAVKYSAADSPVSLRAEHGDHAVILAIVDRGVGIPIEAIRHLFEPYFRAEGTGEVEGIGLGLYITAQLVKAHGGHIWVESEVGKGSTFFISLPTDDEDGDKTG